MSYQVHNFRTGDVIEAAPVNEMDAQIQLNEQNIGTKVSISDVGVANGIAELDSSGKVPASQLPSYVDDVVEYASVSEFPATGETGKIYVAIDTGKTYRWGGSEYIEISASLALGETSSTAYRGDRGKAAYDHATAKGSAFESGFYKIQTNTEGHVTGVQNVVKSDITSLGIPGEHQDISGKADKVENATNRNFAALDSNGNLIDSGHKHSDYLTQHQDISGKADKVENATSGNFASLDSNGNIVDSGHKHSDYLTQHQDISGKIDVTEKGAANGVAELDENGKVPSSQLPGYVDDVEEYDAEDCSVWTEWVSGHSYAVGDMVKVTSGATVTGYVCIKANSSSTIEDDEWRVATQFPAQGESGKIYVATSTNITYRWAGSAYVEISASLALGETSATAYRGDRGKTAYDHATDANRVTTAQAEGFYKVAVTSEGHVKSVSAVQKSDITALGIPAGSTYTYIKYAANEPTADSDMKTTPDQWIGIAVSASTTAPTSYTDYTWYKFKGETGATGATGNGIASAILNNDYTLTITFTDGTSYTSPSIRGETGATGATGTSAYVHIRYAADEPTQDSDMETTADEWIGVYSGTSATAPTTYTSYTWYKIKGDTGNAGTDAYVYIRYAASEPTQDSDMKTTADAWMGIYSGSASTAPTTYTSYTWYKIKGDIEGITMNGSAVTVDQNGIADLGTVITDVSDKADKTDTVLNTTLSRGRKDGSTVGTGSFAFGNNLTASGNYSHAEGGKSASEDTKTYNNVSYNYGATGAMSHVEGENNIAYGPDSHSEGLANMSIGIVSHTEGANNVASGMYSHAEGYGTTASASQSHAEGNYTLASGDRSHAEGDYSKATGVYSHAEGGYAVAAGSYSHSEGDNTLAYGNRSHAEGMYNIAYGEASRVSGKYSVGDFDSWSGWVSGTSYAVGDKVKITTTISNKTVAKGYVCTTANSDTEFTSSKWSEVTNGLYAEVVGNGTSENSRSNARSLDWAGNEYLKGDIYVGCNADSSGGTKLYNAVEEYASESSFPATGETGKIYIADDNDELFRWDTTSSDYVSVGGGGGGGGSSGLHKVSLSIATTDWTSVTGGYSATVTDSNIGSSSEEIVIYDDSIDSYLESNIRYTKDASNNALTFTVTTMPTGTISGRILVITGGIDYDTKLNANQGSANSGKFMKVGSDGALEPANISELPAVTSSDNGKFLCVSNGAWAAVTMQAWQGGSY